MCTVSTTLCITINTTPSYSARKRYECVCWHLFIRPVDCNNIILMLQLQMLSLRLCASVWLKSSVFSFHFSRPTPLSRQLRTQAKRKWCSSAWPTRAGWTLSLAPLLSCLHSALKPELASGRDPAS